MRLEVKGGETKFVGQKGDRRKVNVESVGERFIESRLEATEVGRGMKKEEMGEGMHSDSGVPKAVKEEGRPRAQRGGRGGASGRKLMMTVPQTLDDQGTMSVEMSFFQSRKESPSHRFAHLYWYFPWFHELSFPWYGFEKPIEPVEPVEIPSSYSLYFENLCV